MKDYGKALKLLRKKANMTQAQLAERLNVTYQTVSKWENGINTPDISVIEDMCALFGVDVLEFLRLADNVTDGEDAAPDASSDSAPIAASEDKSDNSEAPAPVASCDTAPRAAASTAAAATPHSNSYSRNWLIAIVLIAVIAFLAIATPIIVLTASRNGKPSGSANTYNPRDSVFYMGGYNNGVFNDRIGFFVDGSGKAVVPYSQTDGVPASTVFTERGGIYDIDRILGIDSVHGVALVHVDIKEPSKPVAFCKTSKLKTSDELYAVDFLYGEDRKQSCMGKNLSYVVDGIEYIKTSEINLENSVLLNKRGELVGFNTAACDGSNVFVRADDIKALESNIDADLDVFNAAAKQHATVKYMTGVEALYELSLFDCEKVPELKFVSDGMQFLGWYADKDFNSPFDFSQRCGTGVTYVYAKTKQSECKVLFDGGDAIGSVQSMVSEVDGELTLPANGFIRIGYSFGGWDYGGKTYAAGETLIVPDRASISVQPAWTPITYTVQYKYGDKVQADTFTYDGNNKLCGKLFEREGYTQVGWTIGSKSYDLNFGVGNLASTEGATVVVSPKWLAITYTVRLDVNNDMSEVKGIVYAFDGITHVQGRYGEDPLAAIHLSAKDFEFDGWEVYDVDGNLYTGDLRYVCAEENAVIDVKAKWRSGKYYLLLCDYGNYFWESDVLYTIELSGKEEYALPSAQSVIAEHSVFVGTGYEFKEWVLLPTYDDAKVSFADGETVSDLMMHGYFYYDGVGALPLPRVVLYMRIWQIEYTVRFDGNGGEGSMDELTGCVYETQYALPQNTFEKDGYKFAGWDLDDWHFDDGEEIKKLTTESNGVVTLTARWIKALKGEGTAQSPYRITSYDELSRLNESVMYVDGMDAAHYVLANDIDCGGKTIDSIGYKEITRENTIYFYSKAFAGTFDGNGHVIKNAKLNSGLFYNVIGGCVKRLGIVDYTIESGHGAPLALDYQSDTPLENCYAIGVINSDEKYPYDISGFIANGCDTVVKNCYSVVKITIKWSKEENSRVSIYVGGFVSDAKGMTFENCYAKAEISVKATTNTGLEAGLFAARSSDFEKHSTYKNCFATGSINDSGEYSNYGSGKWLGDYLGVFVGYDIDVDYNFDADNKHCYYENNYVCGEVICDYQSHVRINDCVGATQTEIDNLKSLDWLAENMEFDTDVWCGDGTELPKLKAFEAQA